MAEYTKQNEGEGSTTAARAYNEGATRLAKDFGRVEAKAREAAREVDEDEEGTLARAEAEGKAAAAEDEPHDPPTIYVQYDADAWVIREAKEGRVTHRFDHLEDAERRAIELGSELGQMVVVKSPEGGVMERHAPE